MKKHYKLGYLTPVQADILKEDQDGKTLQIRVFNPQSRLFVTIY
jgi:hypothetical protein